MRLRIQIVDGSHYFTDIEGCESLEDYMVHLLNENIRWILVNENQVIQLAHVVEIEVVG